MAEEDELKLMMAQVRFYTDFVRSLARSGASWALWDHVSDTLSAEGLDRADLAEWTSEAVAVQTTSMLGCQRHVLRNIGSEIPIEQATVMIHPELATIEVVAITIEED